MGIVKAHCFSSSKHSWAVCLSPLLLSEWIAAIHEPLSVAGIWIFFDIGISSHSWSPPLIPSLASLSTHLSWELSPVNVKCLAFLLMNQSFCLLNFKTHSELSVLSVPRSSRKTLLPYSKFYHPCLMSISFSLSLPYKSEHPKRKNQILLIFMSYFLCLS